MADFIKNKFQSKNQEWETPDDIFLPLHREFNFTLDVAANEVNHKCAHYFTPEIDGIGQDWSNNICWMNPPYNETSRWVKKAFDESKRGATVVCFIQARTNTNWWHDYCMKGEVRFIKGRPKFKGCKHGLPQPLALIIFRPPTIADILKKEMVNDGFICAT